MTTIRYNVATVCHVDVNAKSRALRRSMWTGHVARASKRYARSSLRSEAWRNVVVMVLHDCIEPMTLTRLIRVDKEPIASGLPL